MSAQLTTGLIYCVAVLVWPAVLGIVLFEYVCNPRIFGTTRLLLLVVAIDTCRNLVENIYFGLFLWRAVWVFPRHAGGKSWHPRARLYSESAQYRRGRRCARPSAFALAASGGNGSPPLGFARSRPRNARDHGRPDRAVQSPPL